MVEVDTLHCNWEVLLADGREQKCHLGLMPQSVRNYSSPNIHCRQWLLNLGKTGINARWRFAVLPGQCSLTCTLFHVHLS